MSSNPFRKKTPATLDTSRTSSKSSMRCDDPGASGNSKDNKPVRRVRVLSPPPLSPDASVSSLDGTQPPGSHSDDTLRFSDLDPSSDPFGGTSSTDESDRDRDRDRDRTMIQSYHLVQEKAAVVTTPANPFSKPSLHVQGLGDLQTERREEGEVLKAAAAGKKALNVDAFRSLLMTGRVGDEKHHEPTAKQTSSTVQPVSPLNATANIANDLDDNSFVSSTSESQVEQGEEVQGVSSLTSPQDPPKDKKLAIRPPPPSSRHGKSLKQHEPGPGSRLDEENASQGAVSARPQAVSPLRGSLNNDVQPFVMYRELDTVSTEAEVNEASQPQVDSTARRQNTTKKSAPAPPPPPRRGHSRSDTKLPLPLPAHSPSCAHRPSSATAATSDSASRPETTKPSGPVPTPPPSRRPHTASRQTSQLSASAPGVSSPTSTRGSIPTDHAESISSSPWPDLSAENHHSSKSSAPPPPPARQSSTRRPSSLHSTTEGQPRRVSSASEGRSRDGPGVLVPPPPPPPRNRSGSGHGAKRASEVASPVEGPGLGTGTGTEAGNGKGNGKGADILADLDALQREVDALRGKMN
ncbi:hypothetical protein E4U56_001004 [Claviceps arundinis]|uniref:Uncharacterized protein n=1 Tax=Claviceps arundinis TaxID=1623583 RepID=A0A9P7SPT9_9HYPO|nr:hypothetical protein E4U56_001004 [Claviceps arundinis]